MTEATAPNRFARRRQKTREAIIGAAVSLYQTKGVQVTSLEEICERADVAVRTFFNHFETRENLHEAIAHQRAVELARIVGGTANDDRPFVVRLEAVFSQIADYLAERPAYRDFVGEMLQVHPARGSQLVRGESLSESARAFVESGIARNEIETTLPAHALADVLLGAITIAISNWSAASGYDVRQGMREAAAVLRAICETNTEA